MRAWEAVASAAGAPLLQRWAWLWPVVHVGVVALASATGGDPTALADAPENLRAWRSESVAALPLLVLVSGAGGGFALRLAARGRPVAAGMVGAMGAWLGVFAALLAMNDWHAPGFLVPLSLVMGWMGVAVGAVGPLAADALRRRLSARFGAR